MALTVKQKAFADYYIELGNATEAYKRAYTNVTKQRTAESAGNRLLSNVEVIYIYLILRIPKVTRIMLSLVAYLSVKFRATSML